MDNIISLRDYINNRKTYDNLKIQTFCRLMRKVNDATLNDSNTLININLDDIKINTLNGDIVLPDVDVNLDKTIAGFNTGVSLLADRKSTLEHKNVSFALMVLGWYVNNDSSSIISDIDVLENFDYYMSKVPNWLQDFFVGVFKKMDYSTSFSDYYKKNFEDKIKEKVRDSFKDYNLNEEQFNRIFSLIASITNRKVREKVDNE